MHTNTFTWPKVKITCKKGIKTLLRTTCSAVTSEVVCRNIRNFKYMDFVFKRPFFSHVYHRSLRLISYYAPQCLAGSIHYPAQWVILITLQNVKKSLSWGFSLSFSPVSFPNFKIIISNCSFPERLSPFKAFQHELQEKRDPTCDYNNCYNPCMKRTGKPSSCSYCGSDCDWSVSTS